MGGTTPVSWSPDTTADAVNNGKSTTTASATTRTHSEINDQSIDGNHRHRQGNGNHRAVRSRFGDADFPLPPEKGKSGTSDLSKYMPH